MPLVKFDLSDAVIFRYEVQIYFVLCRKLPNTLIHTPLIPLVFLVTSIVIFLTESDAPC